MVHQRLSLYDFGPLAGEYERWYNTPTGRAHDQAQKRDVRSLLPIASANQTLLDVGCGTGHWSTFFAEMGYRVTGVDISDRMIEAARPAAPQCTFLLANAGQLPFDNGAFDVVAAMATLEFLSDPAAAVREMVRCAKEGGRLLVGTLNRLAQLNQQRIAQGKQPYASAQLLSPDELGSMLAPLGHVRMVATSPSRHAPWSLLQRITGSRGKLTGPFIVAEVQL
jgi:SAM-dependent methyltransferase